MKVWKRKKLTRRDFIKRAAGGIGASFLGGLPLLGSDQYTPQNELYWNKGIPDDPFYSQDQPNYHAGLDSLLSLMGDRGLKFYRSDQVTALSGPSGIIAPEAARRLRKWLPLADNDSRRKRCFLVSGVDKANASAAASCLLNTAFRST